MIVIVVVIVMPRMEDSPFDLALWAARTPLLVILVQAGARRLLARTWVALRPMRATTACLHRAFRSGDTFLLAAGLVGVLVWWPDHIGTALS